MNLGRTQLAAALGLIVFTAVVLIGTLYRLLGEVVALAAAAAVSVAILAWTVDYVSERWTPPAA